MNDPFHETVEISAHDMPPNATITIRVAARDGFRGTFSAVTDKNGALDTRVREPFNKGKLFWAFTDGSPSNSLIGTVWLIPPGQ